MDMPTSDSRRFRLRGFTLIELMIGIAIVAVLAAIAFPSYLQYLVKGRRAAAQSALMDIAQRQQQYLLDVRSYAPDLQTLNVSISPDVSRFYTITIAATASSPPSFTATATPRTGTGQATDVTLAINMAGVKSPSTAW